jgi:hypothetical protein
VVTRVRPDVLAGVPGPTLVPIPTLYVMLEERFPRRVPAGEVAPVLQGDLA